jgi:hypothetical protein
MKALVLAFASLMVVMLMAVAPVEAARKTKTPKSQKASKLKKQNQHRPKVN